MILKFLNCQKEKSYIQNNLYKMTKNELIEYLNTNTSGNKAGRKEFRINDIFISSSNQTQNFRLTGLGKGTMSKYFQKYELFLYSSSKLETGSQIIELDKYMKTPYYLRYGKLTIFEETLAAEFVLLSCDFDLWIQNKKFAQL